MERMERLTRLKLVIPLRRSPHPPEYSAKGVAVGMFWAMTPLVGIQMYLCLMTWLAAKPFKQWHHSLVIACAWTWVTNVFTMLPIYYVFYVTGQIMLGNWNDISGYQTFLEAWDHILKSDSGFWESFYELFAFLLKELGISMMLGCLPYAIGGAWVSYHLSYKYIVRRRRRRKERLEKKAAAETARSNPAS